MPVLTGAFTYPLFFAFNQILVLVIDDALIDVPEPGTLLLVVMAAGAFGRRPRRGG